MKWILALLFFSSLLAAGAAPQIKEKKKDDKQPPPLNVKLNVTVIDLTLHPVNDLTKDRFEIFEDDVPQTVSVIERTAGPASIALAIDTSLSLRNRIDAVIYAGKLLVSSVAPDDQVLLERFISSDKIKREQDFTSDRATLLKALDNLYLEGGQSAVIDGVYLACEAVEQYTKEKKSFRGFIVLITDGDERHSYYTRKQLVERLKKAGIPVLVLGFTQGSETQSGREKQENLLNLLSQQSRA